MKRVYIILFLILLSFVATSISYLSSDNNRRLAKEEKIVKMTNLAYPSLGVSWYEPRVINIDRDQNPAYFDISSPNRLNFIYKNHQ